CGRGATRASGPVLQARGLTAPPPRIVRAGIVAQRRHVLGERGRPWVYAPKPMRSDVSVGSAAAPQWHDIVQILYKLVDAVSRATSERVIHEEALVALMSSVTPDRAGILVCDDDGVMRFRASRRLSDAYRKAVEGHSPWTRDTSDPQPVVVGDALADDTLGAFHRLFREEGLGA